ncbi:polyprenyl synthetase family protein, partial [Mycobacterium kansasii]
MEKTVAGVSLGSDEFAAGIRADLARVEQVIADGIAEADGCVIEEALHLFQAGGKRFRPMFTVLSGRIGGAPSDQVITAAAA